MYGTNAVLETVIPGLDQMSFFSWPTAQFATARYPGEPLGVRATERVTDPRLLAEAATLVPELAYNVSSRSLNPVSMKNRTVTWHAWDLWRVDFDGAVPAGVGRTALVQAR